MSKPMNKRITTALVSLLLSLALFGTGWWLKGRVGWEGANWLILGSGVLALVFAVALLRRIAKSSRPAPMD
ncbi:hypothetical protein [Hymenobacter terricola]|uniref:hypothetical protein n=1 Tax=Hymenobacter terricola TaxID=2819236 RepID=UPI001B311D6E|nr:hypothetical protein [Hymenobacter terricola]